MLYGKVTASCRSQQLSTVDSTQKFLRAVSLMQTAANDFQIG